MVGYALFEVAVGASIAIILFEKFGSEEYCEIKMLFLAFIKKRINERR